jgi:hypothetical protein
MSDQIDSPTPPGQPEFGQQPQFGQPQPQFGQPQYTGAPMGYGYPAMPPQAKNGMAVAALVLGIVGLVTSIIVIGGVLGIVGLILGILAIKAANRNGGYRRGFAIAGTILSSLALVASIAVLLVGIWAANKVAPCVQQYAPNSVQYQDCVQQNISGG